MSASSELLNESFPQSQSSPPFRSYKTQSKLSFHPYARSDHLSIVTPSKLLTPHNNHATRDNGIALGEGDSSKSYKFNSRRKPSSPSLTLNNTNNTYPFNFPAGNETDMQWQALLSELLLSPEENGPSLSSSLKSTPNFMEEFGDYSHMQQILIDQEMMGNSLSGNYAPYASSPSISSPFSPSNSIYSSSPAQSFHGVGGGVGNTPPLFQPRDIAEDFYTVDQSTFTSNNSQIFMVPEQGKPLMNYEFPSYALDPTTSYNYSQQQRRNGCNSTYDNPAKGDSPYLTVPMLRSEHSSGTISPALIEAPRKNKGSPYLSPNPYLDAKNDIDLTTKLKKLANSKQFSLFDPIVSTTLSAIGCQDVAYLAATVNDYLNKLIQNYDPLRLVENESSLVIMSARVGQKSYGAEKRFLCPPPTIVLTGNSWWKKKFSGLNEDPQSSFTHPIVFISVPYDVDSPDLNAKQKSKPKKLTAQNTKQKAFRYSYAAEWCNVEGNSLSGLEIYERSQSQLSGRLIMRNLHINDFDSKNKKITLNINIHSADGLAIGEFNSCPIKVISKPSKKRQKAKNNDLCIYHGSTISLFNRLRSQTVSTKYLSLSEVDERDLKSESMMWNLFNDDGHFLKKASFVTRSSTWDPFIIWLVDAEKLKYTSQYRHDTTRSPFSTYPSPPLLAKSPQSHYNWVDEDLCKQENPIPILYNQLVVLQCAKTGITSPVFKVRKAEKCGTASGNFYSVNCENQCCMDCPDAVSQMHRIVFELYQPNAQKNTSGSNDQFLSCIDDSVALCPGELALNEGVKNNFNYCSEKSSELDASSEVFSKIISDKSVWTIVGTDIMRYRFYEDKQAFDKPANLVESIKQFPVVYNMYQESDSGDRPMFYFVGENFSNDLTVWFGSRCSKLTEFRSSNLLVCHEPEESSSIIEGDGGDVPVFLVRTDGCIIWTNCCIRA